LFDEFKELCHIFLNEKFFGHCKDVEIIIGDAFDLVICQSHPLNLKQLTDLYCLDLCSKKQGAVLARRVPHYLFHRF